MNTYVRDLIERVVSTFAAGVVGVLGVNGVDLTDRKVWLVGALAGAFSVLKGLAARGTGDKNSAGL